MKIPSATYRVQLSPDFTFSELEEIIPYLEDFGISTIYSAPFFQARAGSMHGYDIVDPFKINSEIGDLDQFRKISKDLRGRNMGWLQDIVPNHMAYDNKNIWIRHIFEFGKASPYYNFFDINWDESGKVMAPFLGDELEKVIEKKELKIVYEEGGFFLQYYDHIYPASTKSYLWIFSEIGEKEWSEKTASASENPSAWKELKEELYAKTGNKKELREKINDFIASISGSKEQFKKFLDLQNFIPTHWKKTEKHINYRRFFTINDLICLRMEDKEVLREYHKFITELCKEDLITGLRIDHIDGLFDPAGYLEKLRELVGEDFYIIIEKILEWDEKLLPDWKTQGTSGYAFLALVNNLYTAQQHEKDFFEEYKKISPAASDYEDLVFRKKLFILLERMAGELQNLLNLLEENKLLPDDDKKNRDNWREALSVFLAAFPVYRIYPVKFPLTSLQEKTIGIAYKEALQYKPERKEELDYLKSLFLGEAKKEKAAMLYFLQRSQQFTGPLAAKGVEDTSFYIYNRLISHNEVGDSPHVFGFSAESFHDKMKERLKNFPLSVNATATHDTKRGEDARMRINVLSEIPGIWFKKVEEWKKINASFEKDSAPSNNEEYFIYQTLLGASEFGEELLEKFLGRTKDYLQKVLREAKQHSNWSDPDENYETAIFEFVEKILQHEEFRNSFDKFGKKIARAGAVKSLSQGLIKITAPGIPDIYQGTELWDLSYVDPDNRRPVNYELRKEYLKDFRGYSNQNALAKTKTLAENFTSGKIKMYSIFRALKERRENPELFEKGEYIPLSVTEEFSEKIICYARRKSNNWYLIIAPIETFEGYAERPISTDDEIWKNARVSLPDGAPTKWQNLYTLEELELQNDIQLNELLKNYPIGFLKSIE